MPTGTLHGCSTEDDHCCRLEQVCEEECVSELRIILACAFHENEAVDAEKQTHLHGTIYRVSLWNSLSERKLFQKLFKFED